MEAAAQAVTLANEKLAQLTAKPVEAEKSAEPVEAEKPAGKRKVTR
jgi:hypothetical protein